MRENVAVELTTIDDAELKALRTRLVWSLVPDELVQDWATGFHLVPASDEGAVLERDAAASRRNRLRVIEQPLNITTLMAADVLMHSLKMQDPDIREVPIQALPMIVGGVVQAVLSNLIDMGHLLPVVQRG
jgi:hypothetical protein